MRILRALILLAIPVLPAAFSVMACSSSNSTPGGGDGGAGGGCANAPALADSDYCKSCTPSSSSSPASCTAARPINACCTWVSTPTVEITRGLNLHFFSGTDPTLNLGCLSAPAKLDTPKTATIKGYVKLFSSGNDSAGVKIEIFKEGANGALGDPVGQAFVTQANDAADPPLMPKPTWLDKCPQPDGCSFRSFTYPNVPTETPLIIKTSDASGGTTWADLYDYDIYFANGQLDANGGVSDYYVNAVAATDIRTVAAAVGLNVKPGMGLIAGEVHDCGDVRLSGAQVDTDMPHDGPIFYFSDQESNPLPDQTRNSRGLGTSTLGLFGALNVPTGTPIHVSAVGKVQGQDVLLGQYTIQTFPNAVTALSFRGRRPWQQ
jgi:hypothetical protein